MGDSHSKKAVELNIMLYHDDTVKLFVSIYMHMNALCITEFPLFHSYTT